MQSKGSFSARLSEKRIREVFSNIPELETERLRLRKITLADAEDMYAYSRLPEVTEYLTWNPHKSPKETLRYVRLLERKYAKGAFWDFGVEHRETGKMIGTCGFTSFCVDENSAEIGYVISPSYRGCGLAVEACRAVMKFGFITFDLDRICARFIEGNAASERVMQKLSMTYAETYRNSFYIKNRYRTVIEYAITKKAFFAQNAEI